MKISEINIIPYKGNKGLVGLASCVIEDVLYLGSIGIYSKREGGYRITFPNKSSKHGMVNVFHPIQKDFGLEMETKIIEEFKKVINIDNIDLDI